MRILGLALPGLEVVEVQGHGRGLHARAEVPRSDTLRFAYLSAAAGTRLRLELYPGDTLTQARALFRDPVRTEGLLALRESGWELHPNLHFGFMAKGLTWTRSRVGPEIYAAYWTSRIGSLGAFRRDDWPAELDALVAAGIFDPRDRGQFDRDFTDTSRAVAVPRPGFRLVREWELPDARRTAFPREVRPAVREALVALGERRAAAAL